jgi:flavin-dependent dehydrogenase
VEVSSSSFDLAVVGGGPAGAATAITAARYGARVALLEAGGFPRHKVCGEFVSAESLELLRSLLGDDPGADEVLRAAPEIPRARLFLAGKLVNGPITPPALSVPRYSLDLLLWRAAQRAGVFAQDRCEVADLQGRGPFAVSTSSGEIRARAAVLCSGRWSRFSRAGMPPGPKWVGIKAHFREKDPSLSTDLYFFDGGYCGVQPVSADRVNACAMVRSDVATSLPAVFRLSSELAERASHWESLMEPVSTAPLLYRAPQPTEGNLLLAGDAAGFIDPFVGDGISLALRTGRAAADCLEAFLAGTHSLGEVAESYRKRYAKQFAPLIASASRVRRVLSWPELPRVMALQFLRIPGVLPYLIRKTRQV